MMQIITIVVPFFGLIGLGLLVVKLRYVSQETGRYVAEFAVKIAMPAFIFQAIQTIDEMPGAPELIAAAYFSAVAVTWLLAALGTWLVLQRPQTDAASLAMASTFSNSVMLGVPLAIMAFGPEAAAPSALLISLDTPLLWIFATLHYEAFRSERTGSLFGALGAIFISLLKNPIVASVLIAIVFKFAGLQLPELADRTVTLLGQAAVPSMLVALGMSIATYKMAGQAPTLGLISLLKLVIMPALAFVFAAYVFELPKLWTAIIVLFAALPVGANAYLFAVKYEAAVGSVSTSVAVSTLISIFGITGLLYVLTLYV